MIATDRQSVIDRLEVYRIQIDEMLKLLDPLPRGREARSSLQHKMESLKSDLQKDFQSGSTVYGQQDMNDYEKRYFHPAIYEAQVDITRMLHGLGNGT